MRIVVKLHEALVYSSKYARVRSGARNAQTEIDRDFVGSHDDARSRVAVVVVRMRSSVHVTSWNGCIAKVYTVRISGVRRVRIVVQCNLLLMLVVMTRTC